MAEMSLGTNGNPGDVKEHPQGMGDIKEWDGRSNFVLDKGDRKACLKAKHLGKLKNQPPTKVLRHSSFFS
jgi:hypothetical protein